MVEKMRAEKARVAVLTASYSDVILVKALIVAQAAGSWLLLEACRVEASARGIA